MLSIFIIKAPLHMSIISGIIFDHQWQHSQAVIKHLLRDLFLQCGHGIQLPQKTVEEEQKLSSHCIDNPVCVCCAIL